MKYLITAILLSLFCSEAFAVKYDVGIGYTQTSDPPNGRWYQEEFDYKLTNDSWSGHLGLVFEVSGNLNLLVGYKYLGDFKSTALASSSDYNYAQWQAGDDDIWPLATWNGSGTAQGLYLVGEYHFDWFFVRFGGWVHKATWNMKIDDWRPWDTSIEGCEVRESGDSSNCYGDARYLEVDGDDSSVFTYTYGIGKQFDNILITYEVWDIARSDDVFPSTYIGEAHNISLSYRF